MTLLKILTEPAVLIITAFFLTFIMFVLSNYSKVGKNLQSVFLFLKSIDKKEISYRFNQMDEFMLNNRFTSVNWIDFKKALIFPEKLFSMGQNADNSINVASEILLTVNASYFFNEDSLVHSKINYKFIQTMPTLLTGLGPFFTFLKMAIAFTAVDLSVNAAQNSMTELLSDVQIAALCSVFAVGYSLLFIFFEKNLYNNLCKKYYLAIQNEFVRLFDVCSSEQFLLDLVKVSRVQSAKNEKLLANLPQEIGNKVAKSLGEQTIPYLENILYSLNRLNESSDKNSGGDVIDKLF